MNAKQERVLGLYRELLDVQAEENRVAKKKREIKDKLAMEIPANTVYAGVKRTVVEKSTTSWKQVAEAAKATLIPKTRWDDYGTLIGANTKISTYDRFSTNGEEV